MGYSCCGISHTPCRRINGAKSPRRRIPEMVRDKRLVSMEKETSVKIVEDEEPWEPEPRIPKWIRNPGIQVIIIPGRRIVTNNWGALIVVIVIDGRWFIVLRIILRRLISGILTFKVRPDGQALLRNETLKRLHCLILVHRQFAWVHCPSNCILQFSNNIRRHRIISNPPVTWHNTDRSQDTFGVCFASSLPHLQCSSELDRKVALADQGLSN